MAKHLAIALCQQIFGFGSNEMVNVLVRTPDKQV